MIERDWRALVIDTLTAAKVRDPAQAIADGMTLQTFIRHAETVDARDTRTEPRWQKEMRK